MTWDVCDKFVGPMPIAEFLSEFVPEASQARKTERIISFDKHSVSHNEDYFIQAIKMSGLTDNLTFVNTTVKQDKAILGRPDIIIYQKREGHQENEWLTSLDWRAVDVWIENKKGKEVIFRNLTHMRQEVGVECHFWVFSYSIILFGKATGRLLQWDRSGAIYTEIFDWAKDPNTLSELSGGSTLSLLPSGVGDAQSMLAVYMDVKKIEVEDLRQILINDDHATDRQLKPYIIWKPIWETKTLFGRLTFGFVCHDVEQNKLVYLKDYWHTDFPGIEKEGDIYRDLLEAKVHFIPELGPAGNMLSTREHSLDIQCTRTQDYVKDGERKRIWCPGTPHVNNNNMSTTDLS
ncbi:hypothetical protein F5148DRAFT_1292230 [Russula earlei]|uniref:Uncharacterized protein n=1 Tax=Russula earlei TaxID=71964 RepID=A0ACC0TV35_9AGAM|nr:hypothetical protein F5148DRAFT_1292230 [Russula earlei]